MELPGNTDFGLINLQRKQTGVNLSSKLKRDMRNQNQSDEKFNRGLKKVAQDFEAIFVKQILSESRKSNQESGLFEKTVTTDFNNDLYDTKLSQFIAENGGLGVGKIVYEKYKRNTQKISDLSDK